MMNKNIFVKILYFSIIIAALLGFLSSPIALLLGFVFTLFFDHPFQKIGKKIVPLLLKIAIVGLGFGMFIKETLATSMSSFNLTLLSIVLTVSLGVILTKLLKIDLKLGYLITSGTSICGGSAIAAISSVIKANSETISISLGIVFLLNSIALFIFPSIGHLLNLTQAQFGMWCAIAIHDTSSVVGAALVYGEEALKVATTVKLARALWIIPLTFFSIFLFKTDKGKIKIPFFILLFILAIVVNSYHILPKEASIIIVMLSKRLLVVILFLVGVSLSIKDLKQAGVRPLLLALILWLFISVFSIVYIVSGLS